MVDSNEGQVPDTPGPGRTGESGRASKGKDLADERRDPGSLCRESASGLVSLAYNRRVGVFVAHPDDEVLWFGGLLHLLPSSTVVTCCSLPVRDPERINRFMDACSSLGVQPGIISQNEVLGGHLHYLDRYSRMLANYDIIVTHNSVGEYGHKHHVDVHKWVTDQATCPVYCTVYGLKAGLWLTPMAQLGKYNALRCYDHRSPTDGGKRKSEALLDVYAGRFKFQYEAYHRYTRNLEDK